MVVVAAVTRKNAACVSHCRAVGLAAGRPGLAPYGLGKDPAGFETCDAKGLVGIDKANWKFRQFDNYLKAIDKIQSHGISVNGCFIFGFAGIVFDSFLHKRFGRSRHYSGIFVSFRSRFNAGYNDHKAKQDRENLIVF